ncbi:MAG: MobF family relaxase [Pirellulales bacterium]
MLTITVLKSGVEEYFLGIANPDYYTAGGEPPGRWFGRGAEALGLAGQLAAEAFCRVLAGADADGQPLLKIHKPKAKVAADVLRQSDRAERVPGYDLCFSAPKSVSVLWAVGPRYVREAVEESFDSAVKQTLDWLSSNIPLCRRGRAGRTEQLAELVVGMFDHSTSRVTERDDWQPQLHRHCVVANVALGADGRWSAVNSRKLHEWARTLGPMFRAILAAELVDRLGVDLIRPNDGAERLASWFEVNGVSAELCDRWSSRRHEIEELLAVDEGFGAASDAGARERANLATRKTKSSMPARSELFSKWGDVARDFGLTPQSLESLTNRRQTPLNREQAFAACWKAAIASIEATQATFTERDILRAVCEAGQALGISGLWLAEQVREKLTADQEILCLGVQSGEQQFATSEMWQREELLLANFETLRSARGAKVHDDEFIPTLEANRLSDEQQEAAGDILKSTSALRLLTGVAGAGKSTTLKAIREAFESAGYAVHGAALAGTATEELTKKAGIRSRTIASHLHRLESGTDPAEKSERRPPYEASAEPLPTPLSEIQPGDVLVLDEAGMVDAGTMLRLTEAANRLGLTLILVGDARQLQPIAPGGPFTHLLGKEKAATLATNLRQHDPADRQAAEDFRSGDAASALRNYAERGRLTVAEDRAEALTSLVAAWTAAGGPTQPQDHVIFTGTRADARAANRLAQRERERAGEIDFSTSIPHEGERICLYDRVLFHKNIFTDGVRNGYRGEVVAIDRFLNRVTVRLDGETGREVTVRLADYADHGLTLHYGQTTHKGQGQTVEHAYLLAGGKMADRELAYVQATRGRCSTQVFVDRAHAGDDLEELANALSRSRTKELAHDVAERIRRREGATHERGL